MVNLFENRIKKSFQQKIYTTVNRRYLKSYIYFSLSVVVVVVFSFPFSVVYGDRAARE